MVTKTQSNGFIIGLATDLIPNGIAIMQHADDTMLCIEHDPDKAVNPKLLLYMYELMSGPNISIHKSEIICVGGDDDTIKFYVELFNCDIGRFL